MTAHKAFQFCLQYKRSTEFRRLCEILRNHLTNLNKYRDQRDRPELSLPETLQLYTETRFEQLKVATELELWQEAFRSVEDIHGLMSLVKKVPKPQLMAAYYAKLTKIFQVRTMGRGAFVQSGDCCKMFLLVLLGQGNAALAFGPKKREAMRLHALEHIEQIKEVFSSSSQEAFWFKQACEEVELLLADWRSTHEVNVWKLVIDFLSFCCRQLYPQALQTFPASYSRTRELHCL